MLTAERLKGLRRIAVATGMPRFRWMLRMHAWDQAEGGGRDEYTVISVEDDGGFLLLNSDGNLSWGDGRESWPRPDTDDPATQGCFYQLMLEAWGEVDVEELSLAGGGGTLELFARLDGERRRVFKASGGTRIGRIIAALERAP